LEFGRVLFRSLLAALGRFEKGEAGFVVANVAKGDCRGHRRMNSLWRTLRVPARPRQMSRQYVALEYTAGAGERHPCRVERHYQRFEFRDQRRRDVLRFVALLELEPVEAV